MSNSFKMCIVQGKHITGDRLPNFIAFKIYKMSRPVGAQCHRIYAGLYPALIKDVFYKSSTPGISFAEFNGFQIGFNLFAIVFPGRLPDTYLRVIGFDYTRLRYTIKMQTTKKKNNKNASHNL